MGPWRLACLYVVALAGWPDGHLKARTAVTAGEGRWMPARTEPHAYSAYDFVDSVGTNIAQSGS
jgi:hypothetical protein